MSYEVQTVQVDALSTTSTPYKLSFEGQDTAFIAVSSVAMMTPRAQPGLLGAVAVASAADASATDIATDPIRVRKPAPDFGESCGCDSNSVRNRRSA